MLILILLTISCSTKKPLGVYNNVCYGPVEKIRYIVITRDSFFYLTDLFADTVVRGNWLKNKREIALYSDSIWPRSKNRDIEYYKRLGYPPEVAMDSLMNYYPWFTLYQLTGGDGKDVFELRKGRLYRFNSEGSKRCYFEKKNELR